MCNATVVNASVDKLYASIQTATAQQLVQGPSQEAVDHVQPVQLAAYIRRASLTHESKLHRECPLFARKIDARSLDALIELLQAPEMSVLAKNHHS